MSDIVHVIRVDNDHKFTIKVNGDINTVLKVTESKDSLVRVQETNLITVQKINESSEKILIKANEVERIVIRENGSTVSGASSSNSSQLEVNRFADEVISAMKLVYSVGNSRVRLAQNNTSYEEAQVLGLALNSAIVGGSIDILNQGIHKDSSFNFPINSILYLGANGSITNIQPDSGFRTVIGKYIGNNEVYIEIQESIIL